MSTQTTLQSALAHARNATKFDAENNYLLALNSYRRSLLLLDFVLGGSDMGSVHGHEHDSDREVLDRDARTRLIALRSRYVVRVEELLAALPANARAVYSGQSFVHPPALDGFGGAGPYELSALRGGASFADAGAGAESQYAAVFGAALADDARVPPDGRAPPVALLPPPPPPGAAPAAAAPARLASLALRLRIAAAALDKRGAFVTPRLAVPLQVANNTPPGARLVAVDQKIAALEQLYANFADAPLSSPQSLNDDVARTKETVEQILNSPQLALSKKLAGEIANPFDERQGNGGMTKMFKNMFANAGTGGAIVQTIPKGDKVPDLASYIEVVLRATNSFSPILDSWGAVLAQNPRIASNELLMQDIEFIAKFFDGVVLAFITRDLERLMERFLRRVTAAAIAS